MATPTAAPTPPPTAKKRAIFLDRDGVLNCPIIIDGHPYPPRRVDDLQIYPDAADALHHLKAAGYLLIVATNQPDVGRGQIPQAEVEAIHQELTRRLPLDHIEVCYAAGGAYGQPSDFRKPAPGMLLKAAREWNIELHRSWMIGDRWRDIDCGHYAGCRTIFIDRGYSETLRQSPHFRTKTLREAAEIILSTR